MSDSRGMPNWYDPSLDDDCPPDNRGKASSPAYSEPNVSDDLADRLIGAALGAPQPEAANAAGSTSRLTVELSAHEIAVALVEYLVSYRGWPTNVRYDDTKFTLGSPSRFSASVGPKF